MTLIELANLLESTGYPVAYSHFKTTTNPPFIVYIETPSTNFFADNKVYRKGLNVDVEVYTDYKDTEVENKIESLFDEHDIPWESNEVWIESEKLFQRIYEISI